MVERLAVSYAATGELVELFKQHLELCQVREGEHVLIHSDSGTYPHYPAAFLGAGAALGADVFQVVHPRSPEKAVIDAWKRADLVIDCSSRAHAYGDIMKETLDSGTRILRVAVPEETLRRLTPTQELRERVIAGQRIMDAGSKMRVTSPSGTDVTFHKEGRGAMGIYSVSDKPGRWDIWPSGMVCCAPIEELGEGVVVVGRGDMMLVLQQYVHEPVYMEVRDGAIIKISGGTEADLLNEWFKKFNDPNAYRIAHIGWGCEKRADWLKPGQDNECYYANMQIAFGANLGIFQNGKTRSRAHHDFPCRFNTYYVDDQKIMENGEFVNRELRFKGDQGEAIAGARAEDFPRSG